MKTKEKLIMRKSFSLYNLFFYLHESDIPSCHRESATCYQHKKSKNGTNNL